MIKTFSKNSSISFRQILVIAALMIVLALGCGYFYFAKKSKSKFWFNEGWYQTFTLQNGMQVIVIPNHKIPAVVQMVWYKVGAIDETAGKSGIAHFLEHLMFKGTKKFPGGKFSQIVEKNGGEQNAFTSNDYTAYYQVISKDKLPLIMELESDRMKNLELKKSDVESERQVIIEERRMRIDNQPRALMKELMNLSQYQSHPYGTEVIGWQDEMAGLTREDALDFYNKHYAPNNALLVVSGDVGAKEVESLARKYYGVIPANKSLREREDLSAMVPKAPLVNEIRFADSRVQSPEVWEQFIAPNYGTTETANKFYASILLSKIMGEGNLSRLYQDLVLQKKLATMAGSDYSGITRGPGEFSVYALPANGIAVGELKAALNSEIEKIVSEGVSDAELEQAKKTLIAEQTYKHEGLENMALIVSSLAVLDIDPEFVSNFPDTINAVTAQEVQDAAREIFKSEGVTGVLEHGK